MLNMQKELEEIFYADTIINSLHVVLNSIKGVNSNTPNYDYIVNLVERVSEQLKSKADPE